MDNYRIESENEVKAYLANLRYALEHGATIEFQGCRKVDDNRSIEYSNEYSVTHLFPNEDPKSALARELKSLGVSEYLRTVKDLRFPKRSEMREFGRVYNGSEDVYIKIRVELLDATVLGTHTVFVMSFHFAIKPFKDEVFPYRR